MDNSPQNPVTATPMTTPGQEQTTAPAGDPAFDPNANAIAAKPEEAVAFESMSGKAQDRFSEMFNRARTAEENATRLQQEASTRNEIVTPQYPQPVYNQPASPAANNYSDDEISKAVSTLKEKGNFTSVDEVRTSINDAVSQIQGDLENRTLGDKYGDGKYPDYKATEVEDYGRRNGIFNREVAYRTMFEDEIRDIEIGGTGTKKNPVIQTPGSSAAATREEPLTVKSLQQKLRGPDGRKFYEEQMEKNPQEFQQLIATLTSAAPN